MAVWDLVHRAHWSPPPKTPPNEIHRQCFSLFYSVMTLLGKSLPVVLISPVFLDSLPVVLSVLAPPPERSAVAETCSFRNL